MEVVVLVLLAAVTVAAAVRVMRPARVWPDAAVWAVAVLVVCAWIPADHTAEGAILVKFSHYHGLTLSDTAAFPLIGLGVVLGLRTARAVVTRLRGARAVPVAE